MSRSVIYTVADGKLTAMTPAAPESEDVMQVLVAEYPEIIADRDGALLLVRREQPIGDGEGDARWSIDHLFVTRGGVPVLVELKRAVDTRLRREVVGQMLDYAANASAYWKEGTIAASFCATVEAAGANPDEVLAEFLGADTDIEDFWQQVDANLSAGRMKLVFVADVIPRELARIVEFMNEQMKADVRAVELNWFEGQGIRAFSPRVIGETERAQVAKSAARSVLPPISIAEWIEKHFAPLGPGAVAAAERYLSLVADAGGRTEVTIQQGSIVAIFEVGGTTLYPLSMTRYVNAPAVVQLNLAYLQSKPGYASADARKALYDRVASIVGGLSTQTLTGYPAFSLLKLNNEDTYSALLNVLREIIKTAAEA